MKLQGLQFLEKQLSFQADMMLHVLLYKNTDPEKRTAHTLGVGMWILSAKECEDIAWNLRMIRGICKEGDTVPEGFFDPYYDWLNDVELDPATDAPLPYDPYREMMQYMHDANAPHGLHNQLSTATLESAALLLQGPRRLQEMEDETGQRSMCRNADDPEGPFRPMTDEERTRKARQQETAFIEATLFLVDFNHDMERLGEMILSRAPFADILALIGPVPEEEVVIF